jgi:DNA-binding transcriptional MerR regulator
MMVGYYKYYFIFGSKNMTIDWTRSEVSKLTSLTRTQLDYLEKNQLITPIRIGSKPIILYSWQQIIILKTYAKLREECSLQALRDAFKYLNHSYEQLLLSKRLVAFENVIYWIEDTKDDFWQITTVSGKNKGQMVMTFTMTELIDDLKQLGKSNILNFEERFKQCQKIA